MIYITKILIFVVATGIIWFAAANLFHNVYISAVLAKIVVVYSTIRHLVDRHDIWLFLMIFREISREIDSNFCIFGVYFGAYIGLTLRVLRTLIFISILLTLRSFVNDMNLLKIRHERF